MSEVIAKFPKIYKPLDEPYRYKVMYGGRGSAKSWTVARKLLIRGTEKKLLILCTRELQKSIKQSVHRLLKDQIQNLGLDSFYDAKENCIKGINGTEFIFIGVKYNPDEIRSTEGIDICWIEEGHNLSESSWDIIDPTVRKEGSEIWITYNTRFKFDHLHKMFVIDEPPPSSWVQMVNYSDNPYLPTPLIIQKDNMQVRDYEKYLHIWEGQLKQLAEGAIFGKQISEVKQSGRLLYIPIQKNCEVQTYSDMGKKDSTAFWFVQRVGMEYRFIDYFEGRLEEVDYYTRVIKALGYNYGTHYMPHDADHDRLGMVRNIRQQFEDGGIKPIEIVPRIAEKNIAIQLARDIFNNCWFHKGGGNEGLVEWLPKELNTREKRAEKGFEALCNYRYKYNDEDNVYHLKPNHDWASNGSDAFMQFAQSDKEETTGWDKPLNYNTGYIV